MKKKIIALSITAVLIISAVVGGTFAYLTDKDYAENVMVLGNVDIIQNEYEHDASGALVSFTQNKPLYPYVGNLSWGNTDAENNGAYREFGMQNVVDKYVTVKNTGKSPAYVRTFIALEMGDFSVQEFQSVGIAINAATGSEFKFPGTWVWEYDYEVVIDGHRYWVGSAVHQDPVAVGEETIPSLLQVYLAKDATNETVERLDGDNDGKYDIIALSQAVQTQGFASAEDALDTAFGDVTAANLEAWFADRAN